MWGQNRDSHHQNTQTALELIKFNSTPEGTEIQIRDSKHFSAWVINEIKCATIHQWLSLEMQLVRNSISRAVSIIDRMRPAYFPKSNEQNRLMYTLALRLRWENPVEKEIPR